MYIWKAAVPPRIKFFFWHAIHGRLWTAERRWRHGLQQDATCALCHQEDETANHLLVACAFSREVWSRLLGNAGLQQFAPLPDARLTDGWLATRQAAPEDRRHAFDSLVLTVTWLLWKERNARTFDAKFRTVAQLLEAVYDKIDAYMGAGYRSLASLSVIRS